MRETDPRDDADALGLQEARDASDPGTDDGLIDGEWPQSFLTAWDAARNAWRDRYDRAEEFHGER